MTGRKMQLCFALQSRFKRIPVAIIDVFPGIATWLPMQMSK